MPRLFLLSLLLATFLAPAYSQPPALPPAKPSEPLQTVPAKSETDQLVDQLIENAAQNRAALPSLTAHETIASKLDEVVFFGKNGDKAEATVRLVRKSPDSPDFQEIRQITRLDNKPVAPDQHPRLQFDFYNDFDDVQGMYFRSSRRDCFSYALAPHPDPRQPIRLSMKHRFDPSGHPQCHEKRDIDIQARIDPTTRQITHLEVTELDPAPTAKTSFASFVNDYAPTKVGDKIYWLPTTVDAHAIQGNLRWKWHSRYSDYHQYTSSVKLLPDTPAPTPDSN